MISASKHGNRFQGKNGLILLDQVRTLDKQTSGATANSPWCKWSWLTSYW
jgi:hypothetical protein